MPAPRKYPNELRERSVRLVAETLAEDSSLSVNAAVKRVAPRVGVVPDTLRGWVKQHRPDNGQQPGTTTGDAAQIKALKARSGSSSARASCSPHQVSSRGTRPAPATAVVVAFIDTHKDRFGIQPICRVLSELALKPWRAAHAASLASSAASS